eukprot:m.56676 g.56676  ORF g.56676 m.56676 type:complete len:205 (-) comp13410_c0_seq1:180-794(-)
MGQTSSWLSSEEIQQLEKETGFSGNQIKRLYQRFQRLDKRHHGSITPDDFSSIPDLALNPLFDLIVRSFDRIGKTEPSPSDSTDVSVNFQQFVKTLSIFLPAKVTRGPSQDKAVQQKIAEDRRMAKLKLVFQLYDVKGDGFIDQDELHSVMKTMVGDNLPDEQLRFIAAKTMEEAGATGGRLSFDQFCKILQHTDLESRLTIKF